MVHDSVYVVTSLVVSLEKSDMRGASCAPLVCGMAIVRVDGALCLSVQLCVSLCSYYRTASRHSVPALLSHVATVRLV